MPFQKLMPCIVPVVFSLNILSEYIIAIESRPAVLEVVIALTIPLYLCLSIFLGVYSVDAVAGTG